MNRTRTGRVSRGFLVILAVASSLATCRTVSAQGEPHLSVPVLGGFPGVPIITGIERTTNGIALTWDGPAGYYQLYKKSDLLGQSWQKFGGLNPNRATNIAVLPGNAFFRVAGPQPRYAGLAACLECHEGTHKTEALTRHANAFVEPLFVAQGGQTNSSCLPCHTVGFGLPTGFISKNDRNTNPRLAGVQCESCHGPAGNHAANENDISVRPRVELASQVCGGCHNEGSHRPVFEQWQGSGHGLVVEDMNPPSRINSCGRCHSGSARLALIKGEDPSITVSNDANVAITCVVCHDPHALHAWTNVLTGLAYTNQLRNPVSSTNDYSLATTDVFSSQYDPNINVCAQCHNRRGATWTSSSRPPHHSPQYNVLLGTVGEMGPGFTPWRGSHGVLIEKQCVSCHMPNGAGGTEAHLDFSSHTFQVDAFESCLQCHPLPELLATFTTSSISVQIERIKNALDLWATTKAPTALSTKYGARSWEYSTPGELSSGGAGPTAAEQALIPDTIKKARFNLYIVKYDGSYGVHNGPYAVSLLESARLWVEGELAK
jgi:Cytochrome c554 and c-prime